MKAIIIIRENKLEWLSSLFPLIHPAMVPLCNKPLIEYLVEFMVLSQCESISINTEDPGHDIKEYFEDGDRWGVSISYETIEPFESIDSIISKNNVYHGGDNFPLIVSDGLFFIHYNQENFTLALDKTYDAGLFANCSSGSLLIASSDKHLRNISSANSKVTFMLSGLESLDDIFDLAMEILDAEQKHYTLTGYKELEQIIYGKNVRFGSNIDIRPPAIIGNNVIIHDNVVLGPYVVIGHNVIIGTKSEVEKSVVTSNTYIGPGMELNKKLVNGNKIFSMPGGGVCEVDDKGFYSFLLPASKPSESSTGNRIKILFKQFLGLLFKKQKHQIQ